MAAQSTSYQNQCLAFGVLSGIDCRNSSSLCAHGSEVGPDPESIPTLSCPVSAGSSVPLRFRAWWWNVVRVITSVYPLSVITPFPKHGNRFGKWAQA